MIDERAKKPSASTNRKSRSAGTRGVQSSTPRTPSASDSKVGGISSEAVAKRTGKNWGQWFRLLDRAGARTMAHKQIARHLSETFGLGGWWAQMVTVGYEQACLGRKKHQKPGGYEISVSKTIHTPLSRLYGAWSNKRTRRRWLSEADFEIRKAAKDKSMRITWVDGKAHVDANFYAKGDGKSQVVVQHKNLTSASAAEKAKRSWAKHLSLLKDFLET